MSATVLMSVNGFNELSAVWGSHMGAACWRGGLALLVALLLVRLVRSLPAAARCWMWRLAFLNLLIVGLWFSPVQLRLLPPLQTHPVPLAEQVIESPTATHRQPETMPDLPTETASQTEPQTIRRYPLEVGPRTPLNVTSLAFIAWMIGVTLFSFRLLWQWSRVRMFLRGTSLVVDSTLQSRLVATCRRMNVRFTPELRVSSDVGSPCLVGVFRPVIVLPTQVLRSCSREALDAALSHELAHVHRRDLLWNWLPAVAEVLFFFHPLVWLARRDWRLSQEIAADELAISASHVDVVDYAGRLLELVSICRSTTLPSHLAVAVSETFTQPSLRTTAMRSGGGPAHRRRPGNCSVECDSSRWGRGGDGC
ncbi:MAG: M56 family metallopeptidase [Planctomycetota bacterium]|nr:M56 family metallopeptidase [Planctomycetota bacterium]